MLTNDRLQPAFDRPFFKEFAVRDTSGDVDELLAESLKHGVLAGVPLGNWYPEMPDCFLVAVTEKRTKQDIDRLADSLTSIQPMEATAHA